MLAHGLNITYMKPRSQPWGDRDGIFHDKLASYTNQISEFWVQVGNPTSIDKMQCNGEGYPTSLITMAFTHTHMHEPTHMYTHIYMQKIDINK